MKTVTVIGFCGMKLCFQKLNENLCPRKASYVFPALYEIRYCIYFLGFLCSKKPRQGAKKIFRRLPRHFM
jgi:hypothetical protein